MPQLAPVVPPLDPDPDVDGLSSFPFFLSAIGTDAILCVPFSALVPKGELRDPLLLLVAALANARADVPTLDLPASAASVAFGGAQRPCCSCAKACA